MDKRPGNVFSSELYAVVGKLFYGCRLPQVPVRALKPRVLEGLERKNNIIRGKGFVVVPFDVMF